MLQGSNLLLCWCVRPTEVALRGWFSAAIWRSSLPLSIRGWNIRGCLRKHKQLFTWTAQVFTSHLAFRSGWQIFWLLGGKIGWKEENLGGIEKVCEKDDFSSDLKITLKNRKPSNNLNNSDSIIIHSLISFSTSSMPKFRSNFSTPTEIKFIRL